MKKGKAHMTLKHEDLTPERKPTVLIVEDDPQTHTKSSQPASFSDLAVGEFIKVDGRLNSDGSLTASNVVIMPSDVGTKVPSDVGK